MEEPVFHRYREQSPLSNVESEHEEAMQVPSRPAASKKKGKGRARQPSAAQPESPAVDMARRSGRASGRGRR